MSEPTILVIAPTPLAVVEITPTEEHDDRSEHDAADLHIHPGGQGPWLANMAASLGATVRLAGPFGGELGPIIAGMIERGGMTVLPVDQPTGNGGYVYDLRDGERKVVSHTPPPKLTRHVMDDLYSLALGESLEADVTVITGTEPADVLDADFYGRLVTDIRSSGGKVVADLSGDAAHAAIEAKVNVLKIAHDELIEAGLADGESAAKLTAGAKKLLDRGIEAVVVSRAEKPALAVDAGGVHEVTTPPVTSFEHRGAGDSMTAGVAVGVARGMSFLDAVQLGAAAGALNVTRGGLGTGRRDAIEKFTEKVETKAV